MEQLQYIKEIEFRAKSAREAIRIALKKMRVKKEDIEIKILDEGTRGLFGMEGAKAARVKVKMKKVETGKRG